MQVKDVELLLSKLLEVRGRYYFERDNSCQRLSKTGVEILCLLLVLIPFSNFLSLFPYPSNF